MGDATGTLITSLDAGAKYRGVDADMQRDFIDALSGAMTSYNVIWTASAGTPAIGNGTLTGEYNRINKLVFFRIELTAGSTTTFGTAGAYWIFTIPVGTTTGRWTGAGWGLDTGVKEWPLIWNIGYNSATTVVLFQPGGGRYTNTAPFTFGNTDMFSVTGWYLTT